VSKRNAHLDQPGVVIVSFADLSDSQERRLARLFPAAQKHPLLDGDLPANHTTDHSEPDTLWLTLYRLAFSAYRLVTGLIPLIKGRRSLARHLTETDDLARLYAGLASGRSYLHVAPQTQKIRFIRRLKGFLSGLETRRYEIWVVLRSKKCCYFPATVQLPEVPLSSAEVVEMAKAYPCLDSRINGPKKREKVPGTLRIMSYNLHSCIGLDGRVSIQRIAEVLHRYDPDFVALQELDVGCARSGGTDQLDELKRLWPSRGEFLPLLEIRGGRYGIGFLSRLEVLAYEGSVLPSADQLVPQEPRGVQRILVQTDSGRQIEIFNTHLGLTQKERLAQIDGILRVSQNGSSSEKVLTGDFNCSPKSLEYQRLLSHWSPSRAKPTKTWFGTFPVRHLDYCFLRGDIRVAEQSVPKESLTRVASDHLPLITDIIV